MLFALSKERLVAIKIALMALDTIQPRVINLRTTPSEKKLIIYSDACWDEEFSGLGSLLVVEEKEFTRAAEFTPDLQSGFQQRKTYIHPAELLAHVGGMVSNLQHITGRNVLAFIDDVSIVAALATMLLFETRRDRFK